MVRKSNSRKSVGLDSGRTKKNSVLFVSTHVENTKTHVFEPRYGGLRRSLGNEGSPIACARLDQDLLGDFKKVQKLDPGYARLVRLSHIHLERHYESMDTLEVVKVIPNNAIRRDLS